MAIWVSKPVRATLVTTSWSVSIGASVCRHSERRIGGSFTSTNCDHSCISAGTHLTSKKKPQTGSENHCGQSWPPPNLVERYHDASRFPLVLQFPIGLM